MKFNGIFILLFMSFLMGNVFSQELTYSAPENLLARINAKILQEAHANIGIPLNVEFYPALRALEQANSGETDGEVSRIGKINELYPNLVRVEPSYIEMVCSVFSKNEEFEVTGWDSLEPYSIGIFRGHLYSKNGTEGMKVEEIETNEQIIQMLNFERIDVAVLIEVEGLNAMKVTNLANNIILLQPPILKIPLYLFLHKKNAYLIPQISAALVDMIESGRIQEIVDEYLAGQ